MLLNCNCAKLAKFEDFYTCLGGGAFFRGHSVQSLCFRKNRRIS